MGWVGLDLDSPPAFWGGIFGATLGLYLGSSFEVAVEAELALLNHQILFLK